jgi:DNA repair exonuclease SbcCD ATPase subunit
MSEDFTQKLPPNGTDSKILTAIENLETHVTKIDNRLESLEKKVDERLHDTRPIWHKVVADIAELQSGQKRLEDGQKRLEDNQQAIHSDIKRINSAVDMVEHDQLAINNSVRRMQLDFFTVNEWLGKLIEDRNQQNPST